MNDLRPNDSLESLRATVTVPAGFSDRLRQAVRERRAERRLEFDLSASPRGIAWLRPGAGRTEASSPAARALVEQARKELTEYLEGARAFFDVPVDLGAADGFQRAVLGATSSIPFGEARSYRWIAERIGKPLAVRAVGNALGRNPVPLLVPCHRVLRSDGSLGGYGLGLDLKRRLLGLEREVPPLVGSATTRIVCRHGCPHERRIAERHRIVFASVTGARDQGYRPCKYCRPTDDTVPR